MISAIPAGAEKASILHIRPNDSCLVLFRKTWTGPVVATVNTFTYWESIHAAAATCRIVDDPPTTTLDAAMIGALVAASGGKFRTVIADGAYDGEPYASDEGGKIGTHARGRGGAL